MAQKDYVARGQKSKKKPAKKTVNKQTKPWLKMTTSFVLLCAFAYGLFVLKEQREPSSSEPFFAISEPPQSQAEENTQDATSALDVALVDSTDTQNTKQHSQNKEPLPVLEEEEWAFIDALPAYSVEVDLPEVEATNYTYIMQCGSFRTQDRAQELRAHIALQGFESEMIVNQNATGQWHRVVLGPFDRKREAERQRHQLRRIDINTCKIYQRS